MNELQEPEVTGRLVRRFGLRNRAPVVSLEPTVQPVVIIDDLRTPDQLGPRLCAGGGLINTGGVSFPVGMLFNPADSGALLRVTRIFVGLAIGGIISVYSTAVGAIGTDTGTNSKGFRNYQFNGEPLGQFRAGADVAPASVFYTAQVSTQNCPIDLPVLFILTPNNTLAVSTNTAPGTIEVSFDWEEILIDPVK